MDQTTKNETAAPAPFYVKGPEEMEQGPEYAFWNKDEFPTRRSIPSISRRDVLKMVGGSIALAGLASGCRFMPEQRIVPFVVQPEDAVTGIASLYASTFSLSGYSSGILVRSNEGRPTFITGNPRHPLSLGGVTSFAQAEVMNLYDPDRLNSPEFRTDPGTWGEFLAGARNSLAQNPAGSAYILTETVGSPSLAAALTRLEAEAGIQWIQYEPVNRDNEREGAIQAFGRDVETVYQFDRARVILSLDADLFGCHPSSLRNSRDIMGGRRVEEREDMNRIYAVESFPTTLGASADHRIPLKPSAIVQLTVALAGRLGVPGAAKAALPDGVEEKWAAALVKDLQANRGAAVVAAGAHLPAQIHALVHLINAALGSHGSTIRLTNPVHPRPANHLEGITRLADALATDRVKTLFILGGNPAYTAPAGLKFGELIRKAPFSARLGSHKDETTMACQWALPESHFLETWGDGVAVDGTISIVQPLIEPIYDSLSALELVDALLGQSRRGLEIVKAHWGGKLPGVAGGPALTGSAATPPGTTGTVGAQSAQGAGSGGVGAAAAGGPAGAAGAPTMGSAPMPIENDFERAWRVALSEGVLIPGGQGSLTLTPVAGMARAVVPEPSTGLEVILLPDPTIYDGRYANNMWLQELPKPITNFTWDNCFLMSPATAKAYKLERNKFLGIDGTQEIEQAALGMGRPMAEVSTGGKLKAATSIQMGQADDTIVIHLGYGRTQGGSWVREADVALGGGFNAFLLKGADSSWFYPGATMIKVDGFYGMANTQFHNALETKFYDKDRNIIRESSLEKYRSGEPLFKAKVHHVPGVTEEKHGKEGEGGAHAASDTGHAEATHGPEKHAPLTMYDDSAKKGYEEFPQWAMTIDLNLCTGCGACVTACQSENNIPSVGKVQVQKGREMHWIRIDRYYMGTGETLDEKNPPIRFMPMACVHCENAPCEPVCPVAATVHSHDGLNQMVYNRCVGTRYCSNNCPYKVRRFNFLHYTMRNDQIPVLQMLNNPDVTVRGRGVMEKCTYCVQRIKAARITAKKEARDIRDGEVVTACQAACPSQAIIFGDSRDENSRVSQSRKSRRSYLVLEEANTLPRTSFLMRINNPNPEIVG